LGTRLGPGRRSLRLAAGSTVADVLRPSSGTRRTFAARPRPFIRTRIVHETGAHNAELDRGRTVRGLVFEPPKVTSELNGWAGRGAVHLSDRSGSHRLGLDIGEAAATGLPHSAAITFSIRLHCTVGAASRSSAKRRWMRSPASASMPGNSTVEIT